MTKMTYAQAIDFATEIIKNGTADFHGFSADEYIKKLDALKVSLAKRGNKSSKPTKTQRENASLKEDMWAYISENGAKRATEVAGYFDITGQKASALLNQLVADGNLEKYMEKRVAFFRVAEGA